MEEAEAKKEDNQQVLKVLEALKQASRELQNKSSGSNSSAIKALLELQTETDSILSTDPLLSTLSHHLSDLKSLIQTRQNSYGQASLKSFLTRRASSHEISKVACLIETEIQSWIDREIIENLTISLRKFDTDEVLVERIEQFTGRISEGFSRELQDLILKSRVFEALELILFNSSVSKKVRESAGFGIAGLIRFNKDVFVGKVVMGQTIRSLVSLSSCASIKVLCSLIKSIKSPLVDEIESNNEIPKIICLLSSVDHSVVVSAMDCVLEMGYYGRKEAIEAMLNEGVIAKLVELQRSELGGDLIDLERFERGGEKAERKYLENHPFASCVARFAVMLEVGEGLRQREKRAFKQEILKGVREACGDSDAKAATITAEVLWGSSP
ncbi:Latent-transforming growth factor beta-binding protein like [Heracleum sosnowskyi]|uniref:Latent-transforming growth factor beta-binding protein like n=1 Tax=Heracleum sosnowskyi TaxID=360622 RepID=A0AAD8IPJ0_9APIA|nr:Latent-transforming growth factor beta-binding protein like [Heracleum sosnowskyi]